MNESSQAIHLDAPVLFEMLSKLGEQVEFPADIPFQAAQARGKELNATIGQITDGLSSPITLPQMAAAVVGLDPADRNLSFLYSPIAGIKELRERWRDWQRRGQTDDKVSSLPVATTAMR